jgi:aminopeptidase N
VRASLEDHDIYYYDIKIDDGSETVAGSVVMRATSAIEGLSTAVLDLYDNMTVDSVEHEGAPATYTHSSDVITVTLNSAVNTGGDLQIEVVYHGTHEPVWNGRARPFHMVWRGSGYRLRAGSLRRLPASRVLDSCAGLVC